MQGPAGIFILEGLKTLWEIIINEMMFTLDGLKELLCQASTRCRMK